MRLYKAESTLTCDSTRHARDLLTGLGASCEPRRAEHCDRLCRCPGIGQAAAAPRRRPPLLPQTPGSQRRVSAVKQSERLGDPPTQGDGGTGGPFCQNRAALGDPTADE